MKKFKMLEKAMIDFPTGTVARFKSAPTVDHTSDGIFRFCDFNHDGKLHIVCGKGVNCFYSDGEWAKPVKESILSGKCAIAVNNEREFKLLMEHYDKKGWKCEAFSLSASNEVGSYNSYKIKTVSYSDRFYYTSKNTMKGQEHENQGYKIIPFKDFAAETGTQVPVFVMTSEDGVPLYKGDIFWHVVLNSEKWSLNTSLMYDSHGFTFTNENMYTHLVITKPETSKSFSNKQAAETWIKEQNKPKEVVLDYPTITITVSKDGFKSVCKSDTRRVMYDGEDIEKIYTAYKSLQ